jgi:BASS family bile acid:Na+ symporter
MGAYALAALYPGFGLLIRGTSLHGIALPAWMLAFLLMNAGLGVRAEQVRSLFRSPVPLLAGLTTNLLCPVLLLFVVARFLDFWHDTGEARDILVGLGLVAAMPIAGSSTTWSQNGNGNQALSLGLVLASTFLSPLTTPVVLHLIERTATGIPLPSLEGQGTCTFLAGWVLLPSLLGMLIRWRLGEARLEAVRTPRKLASSINLLLLCYANASTSLPETVADGDWDFLVLALGVVVCLCALAFASGWLIALLLQVDAGQRVSLVFGLGMSNNGTGLVLASLALSAFPRVLLPILLYNLVQHLVAGLVDCFQRRSDAAGLHSPSADLVPT